MSSGIMVSRAGGVWGGGGIAVVSGQLQGRRWQHGVLHWSCLDHAAPPPWHGLRAMRTGDVRALCAMLGCRCAMAAGGAPVVVLDRPVPAHGRTGGAAHARLLATVRARCGPAGKAAAAAASAACTHTALDLPPVPPLVLPANLLAAPPALAGARGVAIMSTQGTGAVDVGAPTHPPACPPPPPPVRRWVASMGLGPPPREAAGQPQGFRAFGGGGRRLND